MSSSLITELLSIIIIQSSIIACQSSLTSKSTHISIIAASCFKSQLNDYDVFDAIADHRADVFMWTGDAIYASDAWYFNLRMRRRREKALRYFADVRGSTSRFQSELGYRKLNSISKIIGVWDDHDYGQHDGDSTNPDKSFFREAYLRFLDEPEGSERWARPDGGIYTSYYLDALKKVKLILLDIRYNRNSDDDLGSLIKLRS